MYGRYVRKHLFDEVSRIIVQERLDRNGSPEPVVESLFKRLHPFLETGRSGLPIFQGLVVERGDREAKLDQMLVLCERLDDFFDDAGSRLCGDEDFLFRVEESLEQGETLPLDRVFLNDVVRGREHDDAVLGGKRFSGGLGVNDHLLPGGQALPAIPIGPRVAVKASIATACRTIEGKIRPLPGPLSFLFQPLVLISDCHIRPPSSITYISIHLIGRKEVRHKRSVGSWRPGTSVANAVVVMWSFTSHLLSYYWQGLFPFPMEALFGDYPRQRYSFRLD